MDKAPVFGTDDGGSNPSEGTRRMIDDIMEWIIAAVAQLVERLLAKEKVAGSNPVRRSSIDAGW